MTRFSEHCRETWGLGMKNTHMIPPVETAGITNLYSSDINKFISQYNRTGNALALWAAFRDCLQNDCPLPDGIKEFFLNIANSLIRYSINSTPKARDLVADLVLGTKNEGGGPSIFNRYATNLKSQQLYEQTHSEMIASGIVETVKSFSQEKVYIKIHAKTGINSEKVCKNFEAHERNLGSFSISALRRAKKRGGITEL